MSQWTHVLGVIRFEDLDRNIWPKPKKDESIKRSILVNKIFQKDIPSGSEGPLDIQTFVTHRGPTVVLTGDLRDFGLLHVEEICDYLNNAVSTIEKNKKLMSKEIGIPMVVRDAIVFCNVEYHKKQVIIFYDDESEQPKFKITKVSFKSKEKK
jgi:hypothetical protein